MPYIPDLSYVFEDNVIHPHEEPFSLFQLAIGTLRLTSGRIIACDPFVYSGAKPFARQVASGEYPVLLTIVAYSDQPKPPGDGIAFARVQFADEQPVKWELALYDGQSQTDFDDDHVTGYAVDAGTGCFMDADALPMLEALPQTQIDALIAALYPPPRTQLPVAEVTFDTARGLNLRMFMSGFGDGYYASYWGLNAADEPVCLVTDFGMVMD